MRILLLGLIIVFISACVQSGKKETSTATASSTIDSTQNTQSTIHYAKGFRIAYEATYKKITVLNPIDTTKIIAEYLLVEKGKSYTANSNDIVIEIPLQSIASVSTTHLPFFTLLNLEDRLNGFGGIRHVKNEKILQRIKDNKIKEIGFDHDIDTEAVISLNPSGLMVYPYEGMNFSALEKSGIKLIYNAEYLELSPLGKAEWIKFVAAFFNKEKEANELFSKIEQDYLKLQVSANKLKNKPSIFSGKSFKGEWHIPGGKSFAANFLKDAGADYLWSRDKNNNVLSLSFESVIEKAIDADWWLIVGSKNGKYTLEDLKNEDSRYEEFAAFKNKKVLYCNTLRVDYFGDGVAEPEVILKDLIYFLHPELKLKHTPKYFQLLE